MSGSLAQRLRFLAIDSSIQSVLAPYLPNLVEALPGILEQFYQHVSQWPDLVQLFGPDRATQQRGMAHARQAQQAHWTLLFSGQFDDRYEQSVRQIGKVHSRVGLDPSWYIGAYAFTINHVQQHILDYCAQQPDGDALRLPLLNAVNRCVMLDMDIAISVYLEVNQEVYQQKLNDLGDTFNQMAKGLLQQVEASSQTLTQQAARLAEAAATTKHQATSVAASTEQASINIQSIAGASEELSVTSQEISRQVEQSSNLTTVAEQNSATSQQTMGDLRTTVDKISKVLLLIQNIADQTRLLALNAKIESAHAGEAGAGFDVVANEVKTLANQTGTATEDIKRQITDIQHVTEEMVEAIEQVSQSVRQSNELAGMVLSAVKEQTIASREISANTQQAAIGTNEISAAVTQVLSAADATEELAQEVLTVSETIGRQTTDLQNRIDQFIVSLSHS